MKKNSFLKKNDIFDSHKITNVYKIYTQYIKIIPKLFKKRKNFNLKT